jgi:hypothetical protein
MTAYAEVATVLGSILASSDTVEWAEDEAMFNKVQEVFFSCIIRYCVGGNTSRN